MSDLEYILSEDLPHYRYLIDDFYAKVGVGFLDTFVEETLYIVRYDEDNKVSSYGVEGVLVETFRLMADAYFREVEHLKVNACTGELYYKVYSYDTIKFIVCMARECDKYRSDGTLHIAFVNPTTDNETARSYATFIQDFLLTMTRDKDLMVRFTDVVTEEIVYHMGFYITDILESRIQSVNGASILLKRYERFHNLAMHTYDVPALYAEKHLEYYEYLHILNLYRSSLDEAKKLVLK